MQVGIGPPVVGLRRVGGQVVQLPLIIKRRLGDALDERVAADLDASGGAVGLAVGAVGQDAGVVDVVCSQADRTEVGQYVPDLLRDSRGGAVSVGVGHGLTVRATTIGLH